MNENQTVTHQTINGKYKIQLERSAVKGVDGFKVEVNSDNYSEALNEIWDLYREAIKMTAPKLESGEGE